MQLKTARRGRNAGGQFWSCIGYSTKQCNGTLPAEATSSPPFPVSGDDTLRTEVVEQPRVVVAQPLHQKMDTVYFEILTVSAADLEYTSDTHVPGHPVVGSQWRLSYARPTTPRPQPPEVVRALSVADKLICKGHVTLLGETLETMLDRASTPTAQGGKGPSDPALDSDEERVVWTTILPDLLGPGFEIWCTPQIEIASLTSSGELCGTEQRVDFLIAHPRLTEPVVLEIDGSQHAARDSYDAIRTRHLEASGYRVLRVPADEVRAGAGASLDELRAALSGLEVASEFEAENSSPIRRAGQILVSLLHAVTTGVVSPHEGFSVWTDLVETGELTQEEFELIVSDFSELLQNVGTLYGVEDLGSGIVASSRAADCDLALRFRSSAADGSSMLVEDVYLPISLKWPSRPAQPACPEVYDRDLLRYFLTRVFRKDDFRDGQYDIVVRALQAKDTVALLPTGAGKSIAFQLAGMLLPGRTIVVAPTISLIRDQVYNLSLYGIGRALGISSDLAGRAERDVAYELLKNGEAFFYYIAPQRFQMAEFRENLRGMTAAFPVNIVVVDEAHCVSEWGHSFLTAYLRVGQTSRDCSTSAGWTPALVALTGTASRAVLRDLQRELQITDFDAIVTPTSFDREELQYVVLQEKSEHKPDVLESYLANVLPSTFGVPPETFFRRDGGDTYCGLVFCPNVNGSYGVVEVAEMLIGQGHGAAYYSGSKPKYFHGSDDVWREHKRQTERRFKRDELPILVATKAFGVGVDKPNIRYTVHYGIPASIEAFYQEAGRAGRDGRMAACAVIVSDDRSEENRRVLAPSTPIEDVARFVESIPYEENDDVTRALFFHVRTFRGVQAEIDAVRAVHSALSPTGSQAVRSLDFGENVEAREKALYRLVVVGVVRDYTVDYSARSFSVTLANATRQSVIDKYCTYVAAYQSGRAIQERRKAEELPEDWDVFVIGVVQLYVQFVYDVIERGQRRAIAEMLAACQSGSGEELRRRILDYLEQAEFSEAVEAVLTDSRSGLGTITDVLSEILSPNDASRLRGSVARSLETYPDHPGLLLLRAATEALSRDGDDQTILENFEAFAMHSPQAYGLSTGDVAAGTGAVLKVVARKNTGASQLIEQAFLQHVVDPLALRQLIAESGIATVQVTPWALLDQVSSSVDRYTR